MPNIKFDRFYRYDEMTRILRAYEKEYPNLIRLESIGKSHEGRDVWLLRMTNFKSGSDAEKPALWVDANLHASEVTGSTAALYLIHSLVTGYKKDETVTRALDTRAFYIVPRVNPDGAEWALADRPKEIRSSTRPYPYVEAAIEGLDASEDVDGDGRILQMRIKDPNGAWKVHPDHPRLMIRRDPVEIGGEYYRVLTEGFMTNYDGVTIKVNPPREALDLNRNFPANWRTESEQYGAGDFPTSEPEALNLVRFIFENRNITGTVSYHTFSGVLLRGMAEKPDDEQIPEDIWTLQKIGAKGREITGYPDISMFHEFRYHPKQVTTGAFDEWSYEHRGIYAWTVEFWNPVKEAGIENAKYIDWYREHPVEDDVKILRWNDTVLDGKGYVDWYEFDHPQLGKLELGGWDFLHMWANVPPEFLEREISRFPEWIVWHALIAPELGLRDVTVAPLGAETYNIRLVVENRGWLPTYVSKKALERKVSRGVLVEIKLPKGAKLLSGKEREEAGELAGRDQLPASFVFESGYGTSDRLKIEWMVKAKKGTKVTLSARHERAGKIHTSVLLK